jgi:cytochrome c peroxidase
MRPLIPLLLVIAGAARAGDLPAPITDADYPATDPAKVALGQLLFYDPLLSGSKTVACATCHHPKFGTSDGMSLGIGDGGAGLGPNRVPEADNMPEQRIGRNAPGLWNLGAKEFTHLFDAGRLEADPNQPGGIRTPLGQEMTAGFESLLAAQAMFPVLAQDEMAGHYSESDVSKAVRMGQLTGEGGAWDIIAKRVEAVPEYRADFDAIIGERPIAFTDIANMIGEFVTSEFRADQSPFDAYLRGDKTALNDEQKAGMELFYGKAGCDSCHSGKFQSDQDFHAIAMPQIGPGKTERFEFDNTTDIGRLRVTGNPDDAYKFRTPSLRNVALTAPYGHDGAYATLEAVIRHHLDPVNSLMHYDISQAVLPKLDVATPKDRLIMSNPEELAKIAAANELAPMALSDTEVGELVAFLNSLTDPTSKAGRLGVPATVPSGLPVE